MMKKVLSLVICVAILTAMASPCMFASADSVSVWDGNPAGGYSWFVSEDVREAIVNGGTIHITDASQLAMLAYIGGKGADLYNYTKEQLTFEGVTFILDTDIDLNNMPWSPICSHSASHPFRGTFEGNGHTIKNMYSPSNGDENMYASNRNPSGKKWFGLFGFLGGTVKNVKIKNAVWEYDSANGSTVPAGGAVAAFIGSYLDITVDGVTNDYIAKIDNCSAENVKINVKRTSAAFGTHAFGGITGLIYNGCITSSYVKNLTIDASESTYEPTNITSIGCVKEVKYNGGSAAAKGKFDISNNFALNSLYIAPSETEATKTVPCALYNAYVNVFTHTNNYSDDNANLINDDTTHIANEEALRVAIVSDDGPYYSEGEGKPVILRSETDITNFTFEYDGEEFVAMANLAKVADNSMLIVVIYDVDGEKKTISDISIKPYEKDVEFNSAVLADIQNDSFDSETQTAKAFIINPENAFPYVKTIEYEE